MKDDEPDSRLAVLVRLGRERDFPAEKFHRLLAHSAPRERRPELLAKLLAEWAGVRLPPADAAGVWVEVERLLPAWRAKMRSEEHTS